MLGDQWLVVAAGEGLSLIANEANGQNSQSVRFDTMAGPLCLLHGPTVLVEENEQTFALAIGDKRSLRNLAEFRSSGPNRHALVCVIDKSTGSVRIITDRINYSKMFCRDFGESGFVLTTHLTRLDRRKLNVSISGLASGLASGMQFNNSTLYRDLRVLERATVHEFSGGKHSAEEYWRYGFDSAVHAGAAKTQLKDAIVEAIRDQVCERPILLSLSGGYDSSGILGVLTKYAKPPELKTFSYVFGDPKPGSDAAVSMKMASLTGVPHENVQAYDGDIEKVIRRNAQLGQGVTNFCDEIDAWFRQGKAHAGSVVLAGDECFGWADRRFVSAEDAFKSVCIRRFDAAAVLEPFLDSAIARDMRDGLDADADRLIAMAEQSNLHDLKDYWYLDQRIPSGLLPWRRFIAGEFFEVREPFLQTSLLEVIKTLPPSDRIGKSLYREAIKELAPEVFSIPRASAGQGAPNWRAELIKQRAKIEALLRMPSQLDGLIEPSVILALLNSVGANDHAKLSWKRRAGRVIGPAARKLMRRFIRPEMHAAPPETMLIRLLVLREFLAEGRYAN